ncbi:autotransporter outer membrane beta-barrel domain-containing protein [Fusobacterium mortiferum]|uniref:autotransporter outer membrane beta-barrel domain-containing protein n=1 Tax=Fusobacterium mortiferum TaxID=850 RepID=UPI00158890F7|nr:autotransporter outer membrane beta-barrel domain-containing protein [Fusobacterium mortiferum]
MQKKKLLLLSAIVLLMGTNSYGRLYPKDGEVITQENIEKHLGEKPDKNGVATIVSIAKNVGASVDEKVNLELVNSEDGVLKKVINIASGSSDIATTNNGIIKATNNGGKGVEIVSIQSGKFVNNGTIGINGTGGKGINITGANVKTENNGTIEVNGGASGVVVSNDSAYFVNNETGKIIATGENSKGIEITKGTAENKGIIEAKDGAIGVYVNGGNLTNSGKIIASGVNTDGVRIEKGNFTTDENSVIEVNGSDKLTSGKSEASGVKVNGTSNFVNNGIIKVSGTTDGAYSGYQSKGININSATATAENKGTIIVERNGIGVGTKGTFTNNGGIKVSGSGIGINVIDSGNAINNEIIEADGKSYGIQVSAKGTATNKGTIIVKNGSTGITTSKVDGNTTSYTDIINEGVIEVSGDNSTGMQANDNRKVVNNGDILVNAGKFTSGMKAYGKNALAENNKNLTIIGDGINTSNGMIAQNGGKVVNGKDGVVKASGKTTSAMSTATTTTKDKEGNIISVIASSGENKGNIILENGAIGIKIDNTIEGKEQGIYSVGTNSGTIKGDGKGVTLNSGIFINSGTIDTTGNAIESTKDTNNTIYLKNGSKINGKIVGNTGIDVLTLEGKNGEYDNLDISSYEAITVRNGNATISNSTIALEYNKGIKDYLTTSESKLDEMESSASSQSKAEGNGNLTLEETKLVIDFKDSLTNPNATENPIIDAGSLAFKGNTALVFNSSDGRTEFNLNEALGLENGIDIKDAIFEKTAVWDYQTDENGNIIAKKETYDNVITDNRLDGFAKVFEENRSSMSGDFFEKVVAELDTLETREEFNDAMAQMSGGIHGYTVDIAAINSRTLVNTMKNRAMSREYLTTRPVNIWAQDVIYLDGNHRMDGLMSASYNENGILGVTEKQVYPNARLGFIYGGSNGKAKFDGGNSGDISTTNTYIGGYYNYDFNNNLSLNTNFAFVYGHNRVNRKVNIGNFSEELKSHYPTYAMGVGTSAIYTVKDDMKNKASFYAGIDVNRIMQGNINEKEEIKIGSNDNLMVKNGGANEFSYYSITPSAGFMVQNTGYVFDKKYLVGADLSWETELGNIKDGKRLKMQGIADQYKVGTMERENIFSTSIFGQIDLTESLALNGRYSASISDNYNSDLVTLGMTYKMDTFADNFVVGPFLSGLENNKFTSDRWSGTFAFMFENEDDSDRVYYSQIDDSLSSGDYATSTKVKPKFTLSLRDKKSKWSYYFEGYYMANDFLKDTKAGEADQKATRIHGEARWNDSYSKGRYGFNVGYRNETSDKPVAHQYTEGERTTRGVHQLRLTPNFSYNLGSGFRLDMKTTGVFEYNYTGVRDGQMDFLMENEHYLVYTGFMPRWQLRMGYYREDRWMDNDSNKLGWDSTLKAVTEQVGPGRYQANQLRPSATYYFGNGDSMTFALRVPLGNGAWYNELGTDKKASESYETRYTVNYNHVVVPGFNIFGELTFLDLKTKVTKENDRKVTRAYSFRPTVGFSYSF